MATVFRELNKIVTLKPEPDTTAKLPVMMSREQAARTVADYHFTPALRAHFNRVFDCVVNTKGQGFWVQAEYGAGKTHFLGTLIDLLVWRDEGVWDAVTDSEIKSDYSGALSKAKLFPVAFSLMGMGQAAGTDSLMSVFEEQIRASLKIFAPNLDQQIRLTSAELADEWYGNAASAAERAGVKYFFDTEHKSSPEDFRATHGPKKLVHLPSAGKG